MKKALLLLLLSSPTACRTTSGYPGHDDYWAGTRARDAETAAAHFERAWRPLLDDAENDDDAEDALAARSMAIRCLLETGRIDAAEYQIRRGASLFRTIPAENGDPAGLLLMRAERAETVEGKMIEVSLAQSRVRPGPALRYVHLRYVRLLVEQARKLDPTHAKFNLDEAMQICREYLDDDFRREAKAIDALLRQKGW